jgi:beta-glucanase (GH16 family)
MKNIGLSALLAVLLPLASQAMENGYTLVWADEFNIDGRPDPGNWTYENGHVRNYEAQWYQPDNAICTNGMLVIEGRRERVPNSNHVPGSNDWKTKWKYAEYTSACLITKGLHSWKYGRFEMRAKIDVRPGLWPAFWTLGIDGKWPGNGEIDIMEYYRGKLLANAFWGAERQYEPQKSTTKTPIDSLGDPNWSNQFHIWQMDWDAESIKLFVDGQLLNEIKLEKTFNPPGSTIENPFKQPHYILVNLAIGGSAGGDPSGTDFPSRYEIDYVRVYQEKELD